MRRDLRLDECRILVIGPDLNPGASDGRVIDGCGIVDTAALKLAD